jgi:hypothetical protein
MYRPVLAQQQQQPQQVNTSVRTVLFSDKNYNTLQTVLVQDFQQRNGAPLNDQQIDRLSKTLNHYLTQVYQVQGEKPIQSLNKEILSACAKDFSQYMQRKELTKNTTPVKTVMDEGLFQETSQRFERLTQERNEVKALPPAMPDFRISLDEDSPPPAELFERAKKQREMEALRSAAQNSELVKADAGLQSRINADSMFRTQQDSQNRNTELALVQRQTNLQQRPQQNADLSLAIMPDRRDLLLAPVGSFDTMTMSPLPRELGQANSNPTIVNPLVASPVKNDLPQNYLVREDKVVSYREIESNLFIYSADRDWLRNNKENRYSFSVNFDPAANGQSFGPNLAAQQKFKNIVRIELVKCIMAGESLDVTVCATSATDNKEVSFTKGLQDNILNFPYITVRVAELENNNYGTDNFLDRSFGVLQYDAKWSSDTTKESSCGPTYIAMIPKFLKCQKEFYPTPLSTLQKMTIDLRRPNGELVSTSPDTFDIGGIIAPTTSGAGTGTQFPFNVDLSATTYDALDQTNAPYNFFINTTTYFSQFEMCIGDRIQISGYTYPDSVLNDPIYGQTMRAFCTWINRPEGHIICNVANSNSSTNVVNSTNAVGYANFIVIQARYADPSTGSVALNPFAPNNQIAELLNNYGASFQSPCRLININKQLNLVFRIITREMDSLPQLRPDNNY